MHEYGAFVTLLRERGHGSSPYWRREFGAGNLGQQGAMVVSGVIYSGSYNGFVCVYETTVIASWESLLALVVGAGIMGVDG